MPTPGGPEPKAQKGQAGNDTSFTTPQRASTLSGVGPSKPLNEAELEPVQESKSEDEGRSGDIPPSRQSPKRKPQPEAVNKAKA